ncbi:extracelular serine carboxypeptidase [Metarhizium rileyi]|uniref:Extracelular serine carboxypeptidase n=1 Tax=Metarhizium rileyi (strain RCEF 4871) TaxID=1649241 RepID=A0A167KCU7_METRR|nr:extracelular serine carboxypeptidase [Metarhizium rileyi RCEF 4871]
MMMRRFCLGLALAASQAAALRPGGSRYPSKTEAVEAFPDASGDKASAAATYYPRIKAYNMSVPIDHFHNESKYEPHSADVFDLRYWVDMSHYKKGGPVVILHSGEFSSEGRLPYLDHGIAFILAKATHGVGIVLEHRYYGTSWPTSNATTASYRFLTTDQALADTAFFSKNLKIPGHEDLNLTASGTPHILYGGSYAGGLVAFARKLYPDVFWGAISSSGVTVAIDDFWQYHEATRRYAPGDCAATTQKLTAIIDHPFLHGDPEDKSTTKMLFGLEDLQDDEFASYLADQLPSLQETNWDPALDGLGLGTYCAIITTSSPMFKSTEYLMPSVKYLVDEAGYADDSKRLTTRMLNYIAYIKDKIRSDKSRCTSKKTRECLSIRFAKNTTEINDDSWQRSWLYQTCTEWGYFIGGASTPKDRLAMVSRVLTPEFASYACKTLFGIETRPSVDNINKHGGFNFSYPRVALIDGAEDPWRSAGVHADGLPSRNSTRSEPFLLLDWGVHHWDENGPAEPDPRGSQWSMQPENIKKVQSVEVEIVKSWVKEFEQSGRSSHASSSEL